MFIGHTNNSHVHWGGPPLSLTHQFRIVPTLVVVPSFQFLVKMRDFTQVLLPPLWLKALCVAVHNHFS